MTAGVGSDVVAGAVSEAAELELETSRPKRSSGMPTDPSRLGLAR
ncbi:MAG: hypothetical protein NZ761_01580 [Dehalococcoidia bacterium]|nr:hypothetical protein [Thermomicrobium sp.]MCS7294075.1 hypothetical protein [Dehalococcoidia bacterium]